MVVKPSYKQTEIVVIPEDWDQRDFGNLYAEPSRNGIYKSSEYQGRGIRIVNMGEMFGLDFIADQDMSRVALSPRELEINALHDGDILFGRRSVVPAGAGKCSLVVDPREPLTFESSIIRTRLNKSKTHARFYYYYFSSPIGRSTISTIVSGTNIKGIRATELRRLKVPLPTKAEQEAIAEALSDADALIDTLDQLIAKKRDLKQATTQQLLTGQKRLPGKWKKKTGCKQSELGVIPEEWVVRTLDQISRVTSGKRLPLGSSLTEKETAHPYIRVTDMRPGTISLEDIKYVPANVFPAIKRYRIFCEDIFISVAGTLGIVGKIPKELDGSNLTENADRITDIECSQDYLLHVLMSPLIQKTIESIQTVGAQPKLALIRIRKFAVPLPTSKAEQEAIAEVLSDMDAELSALEQRRDKTRSLKQGMMQELLTGRTRLI